MVKVSKKDQSKTEKAKPVAKKKTDILPEPEAPQEEEVPENEAEISPVGPEKESFLPSTTEIAFEVLAGKYGEGDIRGQLVLSFGEEFADAVLEQRDAILDGTWM